MKDFKISMKRYFPDKLETFKTLQKVFRKTHWKFPESLEIFELVGNIWVVRELLYFLEISSISGKSIEQTL